MRLLLLCALLFAPPGVRVAAGAEPVLEWMRQFGSNADDEAAVITTFENSLYVAGITKGSLPGQTRVGGQDAFVKKYDLDGREIWTRQFGTAAAETPLGIAVDASGVYLTGYTLGTLPGQSSAGGRDVFVRRYDFDGNEIWTRQFGSAKDEFAQGIAVDPTGVCVAGSTHGSLPGQANAGGIDAFIRKYDAEGSEIWTRQFGTDKADAANGVSMDDGWVYVAGSTKGTLAGKTSAGGIDAFVRKYDVNGNEIWTQQFGTEGEDIANGISVRANEIYVAGSTNGTLPGQTSAGEFDAFVLKFDDAGHSLWARQFGSDHDDSAIGASAGAGGVYVAGRTDGALREGPSIGGYDAFVAKYSDRTNLPQDCDVWEHPQHAVSALLPILQGAVFQAPGS